MRALNLFGSSIFFNIIIETVIKSAKVLVLRLTQHNKEKKHFQCSCGVFVEALIFLLFFSVNDILTVPRIKIYKNKHFRYFFQEVKNFKRNERLLDS